MTEAALALATIPLAKPKPHPDNVRHGTIPIDAGMVTSIEENGILEPLLVLPADSKGVHLVVAGHRRRLHAMKAKGVTDVPCIVRDLTPLQVVTTMMVENLQRADVDPFEEAAGYARMVELDATHATIAKEVGRSARHVKDRLALLAIPDEAIALYRKPGSDRDPLTLAGLASVVKYCGDTEAMAEWVTELKKKRRDNWQATGEPARWLGNRIAYREAAKARAAMLDKVEKEGLRRFEPRGYFYPSSYLSNLGPCSVKALELSAGDVRKHKAEPCHAVYLTDMHDNAYQAPKMETVCTDPKRHTTRPKAADRSALQMKPARYKDVGTSSGGGKKDRPAPKLKRLMIEARFAHLRNEVTGTYGPLDDEVLRLVLYGMDDMAGEARDLAGRILDPTVKKGHGYPVWSRFMAEPDNTEAAILLLAMAHSHLRDWTSYKGALPDWLRSTGYKAIDGEDEWLAKSLAEWDKVQAARAENLEEYRAEASAAAEAAEAEQLATSSAPAPE